MATAILMPRQGQSVESCIITEFNFQPGDKVEKGDILFAYETDKASFEEEAKESGTLLALFYEPGDEVPVLTNVGVIGNEGESIDEFRPAQEGGEPAPAPAEETPAKEEVQAEPAPTPPTAKATTEGEQFISPRAKNLAESKGINYQGIAGSGPKGRIIEKDIEAVLANQPATTPLAKKIMQEEQKAPAAEGTGLGGMVTSSDLAIGTTYSNDSEVVPLSNIRKIIAKAMHSSLQNSAQLTHHLSADATRIMELRQKVKEAQKDGYQHNITLNDMICFAVIKTLKEFPNLNAHFLGDSMKLFKKVHLGMAVDTDRGLMVPAIRNADDLSIQGISSQAKELATACRGGAIAPELIAPQAGSFTISNLGNYGVEMFTPVINLPQVAILGVNTIIPRPKALGHGAYGFVPHLGLSLTYDHQATDGGEATRFLKSIATAIENLHFEL